MLKPVAAAALLLAGLMTAPVAHAQSSTATRPGFEMLVPSGTVAPTGAGRDEVASGKVTALQVSYGLRPDLVLTSMVGWARATPSGLGTEARLNVFTYDMGVEYRRPRRRADGRFTFKPFTGAGLGGRTNSYRHVDVATSHHLATYASVGGEVGVARVRLRLEVRDYLTWEAPRGGSGATRNDVAVLAGLRLVLRQPR